MYVLQVLYLAASLAAACAAGTCSANGQCEASPQPAAALQGAFSLSQRSKTVTKVVATFEEDSLPNDVSAGKASKTLLLEEDEELEVVSFGQLGRGMVFVPSKMGGKDSLAEIPVELLLSEGSDLGEEESISPPESTIETKQNMQASHHQKDFDQVPAEDGPTVLGTLIAVALAVVVGGLSGVPPGGKASWLQQSAALAEDDADPLNEDAAPFTAEECARYCQARKPRASRSKPVTDAWGCTPLHVAAKEGDVEKVRRLLSEGLDADVTEAWDETALHFAARSGSVESCEALLGAGAEVNATNASDRTPLVEAAQAGNEAVCRLLMEHGGHSGGAADGQLPPLLSALYLAELVVGPARSEAADSRADSEDEAGEDEEAFVPLC